jgi:DNA-binding transcriptional MerR regulator
MKFLDIGEVSEKTGIRPSALRYYEEIGLISSVFRHGLRRQFPPGVLNRLKLVSLGKSAGFSLAEISLMFSKEGALNVPRASLRQKAEDLARQIHELTILRGTLLHVAECRAPSHLECPKFRRLMDLAGKRTRRTSRRSPPIAAKPDLARRRLPKRRR